MKTNAFRKLIILAAVAALAAPLAASAGREGPSPNRQRRTPQVRCEQKAPPIRHRECRPPPSRHHRPAATFWSVPPPCPRPPPPCWGWPPPPPRYYGGWYYPPPPPPPPCYYPCGLGVNLVFTF